MSNFLFPGRLSLNGLVLYLLWLLLFAGPGFAEEGFSSVTDERRKERETMVYEQIEMRGVKDSRVLEAMRKVPRHLFVPEEMREKAYADSALPIAHGQTISQPYIVAFMTEALRLEAGDKVLEIGTGSGYQAAVLAEIAAEVYSIEIVPELAKESAGLLSRLGYENVTVKHGDGYKGWPEHAPFDAIIVTAAPPEIPQALIDQLKEGGRLVVPVGTFYQELTVVTASSKGLKRESLLPVRFVPMVREKKR